MASVQQSQDALNAEEKNPEESEKAVLAETLADPTLADATLTGSPRQPEQLYSYSISQLISLRHLSGDPLDMLGSLALLPRPPQSKEPPKHQHPKRAPRKHFLPPPVPESHNSNRTESDEKEMTEILQSVLAPGAAINLGRGSQSGSRRNPSFGRPSHQPPSLIHFTPNDAGGHPHSPQLDFSNQSLQNPDYKGQFQNPYSMPLFPNQFTTPNFPNPLSGASPSLNHPATPHSWMQNFGRFGYSPPSDSTVASSAQRIPPHFHSGPPPPFPASVLNPAEVMHFGVGMQHQYEPNAIDSPHHWKSARRFEQLPDIEEELKRAETRKSREKQIAQIKGTCHYARYRALFPKQARSQRRHCPHTPDPSERISSRAFQDKLRCWKKALHEVEVLDDV